MDIDSKKFRDTTVKTHQKHLVSSKTKECHLFKPCFQLSLISRSQRIWGNKSPLSTYNTHILIERILIKLISSSHEPSHHHGEEKHKLHPSKKIVNNSKDSKNRFRNNINGREDVQENTWQDYEMTDPKRKWVELKYEKVYVRCHDDWVYLIIRRIDVLVNAYSRRVGMSRIESSH